MSDALNYPFKTRPEAPALAKITWACGIPHLALSGTTRRYGNGLPLPHIRQ